MTVNTALQQGTELLEQAAIAAPRLTAEVLLAHALGRERAWLYAHSTDELTGLAWIHYGRYLHERLEGKPTQYITRRQEFYGREFQVTPDVLIPRPETEHAVEAALARLGGGERVADIGTGSGAIAVTLALEARVEMIATDISTAALRVAAANASRLGAGVRFVACDLGAALTARSFDMVVSNPPYVPARDATTTQREVRDWEPHVALFGGDDGLDVYRRLVPEAACLLRPGGWLVVEIAYNAGEALREMLAGWQEIEILADLAGLPRVAVARRSAGL